MEDKDLNERTGGPTHIKTILEKMYGPLLDETEKKDQSESSTDTTADTKKKDRPGKP